MYYKNRYLLLEIWPKYANKPITFNVDWKITFDITKNASSDYMSFNTAEISIYNMRSDIRELISTDGIKVRLDAGYEELHGVIFEGVVNNITVEKEKNEIITTLFCASDLTALSNDVSDTLNNVNVSDYLTNLCAKNNININIKRIDKSITEYTVDGSVSNTISRICSLFGLSYSIDNGIIRVVDKNINSDDVREDEIITVTPTTGLIGNPNITEEGCNIKTLLDCRYHVNGYYRLEAPFAAYNLKDLALRPEAVMGGELNALAFIDEHTYNGTYMILSMQFNGDTRGNSWYSSIRGSKLWPKSK